MSAINPTHHHPESAQNLTRYRTLPKDSKPIKLPQTIDIARRPKATSAPVPNGEPNATVAINGTGAKRKRSRSPEENSTQEQQSTKRGKLQKASDADDLIVLDDSSNGAIVIEDD